LQRHNDNDTVYFLFELTAYVLFEDVPAFEIQNQHLQYSAASFKHFQIRPSINRRGGVVATLAHSLRQSPSPAST
jgi:hypothetical protein